ncbi:hypothetical protein AEB_P0065 [Altererythrobacter sp. B11]|uniref:hypothetical protein n=1 Tax=Altererythrobacter sp. B11 TaxID=2060312 RepID=UPI000DC725D4|nr:hypothetical protein [Altererythrobacter sp. B11]BBC70933.1 hypothetical protein AEB_P0065 [Altererythrobacter sp. B11]
MAAATAKAREAAVDYCASKGALFVEGEVITDHNALVSDLMLTGECLSPGDPGYEEAVAKSDASR